MTNGYDVNGRLTEVKKNGAVVETYTYDTNGNRLAEINTLRGVNRSYAVSDEDHVITTGTETYQPDADGLLTRKNNPNWNDVTILSYFLIKAKEFSTVLPTHRLRAPLPELNFETFFSC